MKADILKLKVMKRHSLTNETRFLCSPTDYREMVKDRKVNQFGQLLSNLAICLRPESEVVVGNIISDNVTLN